MLIAGDAFDAEGGRDFKGPMLSWKNYKNLERYNPARHDLLPNWKTPMMIIHSDMDYRCVLTDGLAAFGVCQSIGIPSKFLNFPDEVTLYPRYASQQRLTEYLGPLGIKARKQLSMAQDRIRLDKSIFWNHEESRRCARDDLRNKQPTKPLDFVRIDHNNPCKNESCL